LLTSAHFTLNYFFKQEYQNFLFNLSYNFLYNCGKLEILLKQQYNKILNNPYVEKILDQVEDLHTSFKTYDTILILNNQIVARSIRNKIIYDDGYENSPQADFMIYNQNVKRKKTNQVVFYGSLDFALFIDKIENCSYEFLSLNVKVDYPGIESKNVDIIFSNNQETLYVVTNRINVLMISYLLKLQHNIETDPLLLSYEIHIIDHNVKFFTLNENEELILFKDHYEKVPFDLNKIKERRNNKNNNKNMNLTSFDNTKNENLMPKLTIDINKIMEYCDSLYATSVMNDFILQNENVNEKNLNESSESESESESETSVITDNSYEKIE
jgi:hypothetical protein